MPLLRPISIPIGAHFRYRYQKQEVYLRIRRVFSTRKTRNRRRWTFLRQLYLLSMIWTESFASRARNSSWQQDKKKSRINHSVLRPSWRMMNYLLFLKTTTMMIWTETPRVDFTVDDRNPFFAQAVSNVPMSTCPMLKVVAARQVLAVPTLSVAVRIAQKEFIRHPSRVFLSLHQRNARDMDGRLVLLHSLSQTPYHTDYPVEDKGKCSLFLQRICDTLLHSTRGLRHRMYSPRRIKEY